MAGEQILDSSRPRIGVAGWSYPDWAGAVYPRPKPKGFDELAFVAGFVDAIEINSTFYHPGSVKNALSWARRIAFNPEFKFTVKLWRKLTHEKDDPTADDLREARLVADAIASEGRLGAALLQFPFSFQNDEKNRGRLFRILDGLSGLPLAVEVRHASFDREEFFQGLAARGVGFANLDQPLIGQSLPPTSRVTGPAAYVRFHGRNARDWFREGAGRDDRYNYLYSKDELKPWKERIEEMAGQSPEVYVIFNNHFKGQALANALMMKALLGFAVRLPEDLVRTWPDLAKFAAGGPESGGGGRGGS